MNMAQFNEMVRALAGTPAAFDSSPFAGGTKVATKTGTDAKTKKQVLDILGKLGGQIIGEDALKFEGDQFILPASMNGNVDAGIKYLTEWKEQQQQKFQFTRIFNYRWQDGAAAFQRAMKKVFGTTGVGKTIQQLFSTIPPQYHTVNISPTETIQVPWGRINFSPLEADFFLDVTRHRDFGKVFAIGVDAPRMYRGHIEAFFAVVENELKTNSIYRGKAFTAGDTPTFIDTTTVDPSRVVYSAEVMTQLDTNVWSLLRYTDEMRRNKIPLKRAVLMEGPYGTGKTLAALLTAREAVENGWTFILARPGEDSLPETLRTAQLYSPAVVCFEDVDTVAQGQSDAQLSGLLDALDGITNKGTEIVAVFTTNHIEKIQMGALRCGRIDAIIHVGGLDAAGFERLVKVTVPSNMLGHVDYAKVAVAFDGFLPAFAKEAITRAISYSISRNRGKPGKICTDDLVAAANALRPHLELMQRAEEGVKRSPLEEKLTELVTKGVDGMNVTYPSDKNSVEFKLHAAS